MLFLQDIIEEMPEVFLWKKDVNSVFINANQECISLFGFNKNKDISGITDYHIPCKLSEFASVFQTQDRQVMSSNEPLRTIAMHFCTKDNTPRILLTKKISLRDDKNNIIGTFGCCIDVTRTLNDVYYLLSACTKQIKTNKCLSQNSYIVGKSHESVELSIRQSECLFFLLRNKTTKEIARILRLSPRTVECYLEELKVKFQSHNKSELIDTAIERGFLTVIPESIFNKQILIEMH